MKLSTMYINSHYLKIYVTNSSYMKITCSRTDFNFVLMLPESCNTGVFRTSSVTQKLCSLAKIKVYIFFVVNKCFVMNHILKLCECNHTTETRYEVTVVISDKHSRIGNKPMPWIRNLFVIRKHMAA